MRIRGSAFSRNPDHLAKKCDVHFSTNVSKFNNTFLTSVQTAKMSLLLTLSSGGFDTKTFRTNCRREIRIQNVRRVNVFQNFQKMSEGAMTIWQMTTCW